MIIGIFDSGVGGLTVLKEALEELPDEKFLFYADLANVPYGTKTKDEVNKHVFKAVEFLISKGAEAVVLACNTATSTSADFLRGRFNIPIIGMEPAVKPAVEKSSGKKILVLATALTLKEKKYNNLIHKLEADDIVCSMPMPELVELAENFDFEKDKVFKLFEKKFRDISFPKYETIVLGCTHFIYFKKLIKEYFHGKINIVDGNKGTVKNLKGIAVNSKPSCFEKGKIEYYISGTKDESGRFERYLDFLD
jgi:glutamate racemase